MPDRGKPPNTKPRKKQAQRGVPHSEIQVELEYLNFRLESKIEQSVAKAMNYMKGGTLHILS